ncbi:TIGR04283 family arsenosugar biosynthesis glycosyltransferase [Alkalinema pantanalense CENA528]|uniref:TIGR04283 family arsenosugar biosynthesis glycosyltransferase n=1 Tax=Alkalinema pantanalense TaxID=1620705 RepID=UPI003D6FCA00
MGISEQVLQQTSERISVIIPTLNEAAGLGQTLVTLHAAATGDLEVMVVDGGSTDRTVEIAQAAGCKVIHSHPGRANQMNTGAAQATGEILLFLHGDTQLPQQFDRLIKESLDRKSVIAGAFELKIDGPQWGLRWVEWGVKWRSSVFQLPYGDQALFLRAELFRNLGGFPELPIMEDFVFVRQLRKRGRLAIVPASVLTSGRRWATLGIFKTTLWNQVMILGFYLGIPPERLKAWYRRDRTRHDR